MCFGWSAEGDGGFTSGRFASQGVFFGENMAWSHDDPKMSPKPPQIGILFAKFVKMAFWVMVSHIHIAKTSFWGVLCPKKSTPASFVFLRWGGQFMGCLLFGWPEMGVNKWCGFVSREFRLIWFTCHTETPAVGGNALL